MCEPAATRAAVAFDVACAQRSASVPAFVVVTIASSRPPMRLVAEARSPYSAAVAKVCTPKRPGTLSEETCVEPAPRTQRLPDAPEGTVQSVWNPAAETAA